MGLLMDVSFACECGVVVEETVHVPDPDFSAERSRDSQSTSWDELYCSNCGNEYTIEICNTFSGAIASLEQDEINLNYSMPYYPEEDADDFFWHTESKTHYDIFQAHLKSVRTLLDVDVPDEIRFNLWVMLHGHLVSAIEGYLAGVFIQKVTNSEELTRKLIETDPEFSKRTFSLKEIFERQSSLKSTVATYLKELIFHDLKKIRPMFKAVLGHDFGDIAWLFKDVLKRHDCVHRAGYNKDGEEIDVSRDSVYILLANVERLAGSVEETVRRLDEPDDLPF